jgi:hypothetical protein
MTFGFQKTSRVTHWNTPTAAKTTAIAASRPSRYRTGARRHGSRERHTASTPNGSRKKSRVIPPCRGSSLHSSESPASATNAAAGHATRPSSRTPPSPR